MYHIIVVEDDPLQQTVISRFTGQYFGESAVIDCYRSAEEYYVRGDFGVPDIALLDIELPGESGILLAEFLNRRASGCQIIYLTGHISYAVEVYRTRHVWFVTKDRLSDMLPTALKQALSALQEARQTILPVLQKDGTCVLRQSEIIYIERVKRTTFIFADRESVTTSDSLDTLQKTLDAAIFVRSHSSFIVNLQRIRYFHRTELKMDNGSRVPVSRGCYAKLRDQFAQYIGQSSSFLWKGQIRSFSHEPVTQERPQLEMKP